MLIINGKIITWNESQQILEGKAILLRGGRIAEIGSEKELLIKHPEEPIVNAHSQYIMPGNICAHTHFYGAYARGLSIPGDPPKNFTEILQKLWWPLDKSLSARGVYYSAMVSLIEAIKLGTTTVFDHHASPNCISDSLDLIARAVKESGLRASLCYEVTDRNGLAQADQGICENLRFIKAFKEIDPDRLSASFGLHASMTLSDATLEKCGMNASDGIGYHIHVAEDKADQDDSLAKSGVRVIHRLNKYGILGSKSIIVHAVHINKKEMEILAKSNTWVTHQPRSNMNNAIGLPNIDEMLWLGIRVCLGNDGFLNGMWEEWKSAYLAHKLFYKDPRKLTGNDLVQIAVRNNSSLANEQFGNGPYGVINPGAIGDLIFVDYHPFTPLTPENLPWHIVFGFNESMITTTIVNGEVLMENRKLVKLDEEKIYAEALGLAPKIWRKYWSQFKNEEQK